MRVFEPLIGGKAVTVRCFGFLIWASYHSEKQGWFRLFGRGLKWKHQDQGLLFSERNGYAKFLRVGKWVVGYLPD
jgi:hypothetical protein